MIVIHNGRIVVPIALSAEQDYFTKYERFLLVQNRIGKFHYLVDRIMLVCPDLTAILNHFREIGNERVVKYLKGRIVGILLIRYMLYLENPQHQGHRMDLVLNANWIVIVGMLRGWAGMAIKCYGLPNKFYSFKIKAPALNRLSLHFVDEFYEVAKKMVVHHAKLKAKATPSQSQ